MSNLKEIYNGIDNLLESLHDYDQYSPYQEDINKLTDLIADLCMFFGIRVLTKDAGEFHKGETVLIDQDENGWWIIPLDKNDQRMFLPEPDAVPEDFF